MDQKHTEQLNEMYRLINFGRTTNTAEPVPTGTIEYSKKADDGQTYSIIRESSNYYIKVAPPKDSKVLLEDYEYLNGFNNKRAFKSYSQASKAFNSLMLNLKEDSMGCKGYTPMIDESREWQNKQTKEVRAELDRFAELTENIGRILDTNKKTRVDEGCKSAPYCEKPTTEDGGGNDGKPGRQQSVGAEGKKDSKAESSQKAYQDGTGEFAQDKNPKMGRPDVSEEGGNPYQKKSVKISEEQERQIHAWRHERKFKHEASDSELDTARGTHIGSSAPWLKPVNENEDDDPMYGSGDAEPYFDDSVDDIDNGGDYSDIRDIENSRDEHLPNEEDEDDRFTRYLGTLDRHGREKEFIKAIQGSGDYDDDYSDFLGTLTPEEREEELYRQMNAEPEDEDYNDFGDGLDNLPDNDEDYNTSIQETDLHLFGKHPAYRKKPMTTPSNDNSSRWGRDWNDESVNSEAPFGEKIGHGGDPYSKIVRTVADAVINEMKKKRR